jgi:hypothetical protein
MTRSPAACLVTGQAELLAATIAGHPPRPSGVGTSRGLPGVASARSADLDCECVFVPSNLSKSRLANSPLFRVGDISPTLTWSASPPLSTPRILVPEFHWRSILPERAGGRPAQVTPAHRSGIRAGSRAEASLGLGRVTGRHPTRPTRAAINPEPTPRQSLSSGGLGSLRDTPPASSAEASLGAAGRSRPRARIALEQIRRLGHGPRPAIGSAVRSRSVAWVQPRQLNR